ncbi:hypothetical protein CAOG_04255 [Capsaspora owczarzaki ATCC 30864]|uniref:RecF/RecN/SMC N-terminal domain-containing protein n=1 Tax=Capsaspora owczarzaki (strain ATCC 30864) TaxID=595528 RepID=A0A0D2VRH3_CAPO3|nr:hypothetical protein CAOG_04255 [Capsaspora owczarzaki ATCC 30864]KJE93467.1 hypothetical protein CAOG_004255 [Capsaspora owczarzaki ATCC 30864]|eukprot:XP_004348080.1 hypothetical protein CAOG_04255 [Capsaspora owczarzaki ATCC 30864]
MSAAPSNKPPSKRPRIANSDDNRRNDAASVPVQQLPRPRGKRIHDSDDDDDDRAHGSSKRKQRLQSSDDDDDDDDDDEEEEEEEEVVVASVNAKAKGKGRAAQQDEDEAEPATFADIMDRDYTAEETEVFAEQIAEGIKKGDELNKTVKTQAGIFLEIDLQNFMCHGRFHMKFSPQFTFVTGVNGSGKSAILCALMVGLGGKTGSTGRGSSIKELIKTGADRAVVRITLSNEGLFAYRPAQFGKRIIVERVFLKSGSSSYKLINGETNATVGKSAHDLAQLKDALRIDVDNPISVLTQDHSREFIKTASPDKLYDLFLRGTDLERMSNMYRSFKEGNTAIGLDLKAKSDELKVMNKEVERLKARYESSKALQQLGNRINDLANELAWAYVAEAEQIVEKETNELTKCQKLVQNLSAEVAAADKSYRAASNEYEEVQATRTAVHRDTEELSASSEMLNRKTVAARRAVNQAQEEVKRFDNQGNSKLQQVKQVERDIAETRRRALESKQKRGQAVEQNVEQWQRKIANIKDEADAMRRKLVVVEQHGQSFSTDVNSLQEVVMKFNRDIAAKRKEIESITSVSKNRLAVYGNEVPEILRRIDAESRWKHKPIGPIGRYLELTDASWAVAVEACLKDTISAFAVDNFDDARRLEDIMNQVFESHKRRPMIITRRFGPLFDVTRDSPSKEYLTVLRVLRCSEAMALNTLIDQNKIHTTVLLKDLEEAQRVILRTDYAALPHGVTTGYDKIGTFYEGGTRSQSSVANKYRGPQKLTAAQPTSQNVESIKHELRALEQRLHENDRQLAETKLAADANKRDERTLRSAIATKEREQSQLAARAEAIQSSAAEIENDATDVSDLEREMQALQEEAVSFFARAKQIHEAQVLPAQAQFAECDKQSKEANKLLADITRSSEERDEQLKASDQKQTQAKNLLTRRTAQHLEAQQQVDQRQAVVLDMINTAKSTKEQAQQLCSVAIPTKRTSGTIQKEMESTKQRLRDEERQQGRHEDITREYFEKTSMLEKSMADHNALKDLHGRLDVILVQRAVLYRDFRISIAQRACQYFIRLLALRGFQGKLKFHFESSKLEIRAQPPSQQDGQSSGSKDIQSLSGGEKSFGTICFLVSLWHSMPSPFRVLDEFDVFMDQVNRSLSAKLLTDFAALQPFRQHILITPQSIDPQVSGRKDIRVEVHSLAKLDG